MSITKQNEVQQLIDDTIHILQQCGIPLEGKTKRAIEKIAMCFLAVAHVFKPVDWGRAKSITDGVALKTRDIILLMNKYFGENISLGSYDDIRRKDLVLPVLAEMIVQTSPEASRNNPTRGYALSDHMRDLLHSYGTPFWEESLENYLSSITKLSETLNAARVLNKIPIKIGEQQLEFSPGEHNLLQKKIIEEFLPRYGYGCEVLYIGDTADKYLYLDDDKLANLMFFELSHGELPDIVAYSKEKNWVYLIEAVHSSGPMSSIRVHKLKELLTKCPCDLIFVSAFLDKATFRKFTADVAWETEVWIADTPDHMIHFNGDKFLGPHR